MNLTIAKSVNFGSDKTGLSTVGYVLVNPDGTIKQARSIDGIVEIAAGQGIYGGNIIFELGWSGFIVWDSGDAGPYFASENFDARSYQGSGGGVALHMGPAKKEITIWKPEDRKKILRNLKKIMEDVGSSSNKIDDSSEILKNIQEKNLKILIDQRKEIFLINEALTNLLENVSKFNQKDIDFSQVVDQIKNLNNLIEAQNRSFEPIIDGLSTLIEGESIKSIQKEIAG